MNVVQLISKKLTLSIENNGIASLVMSGGSSPLKIFEELSNIDIPWAKVQVTLVDDRLVDNDNIYSNQKLIYDYFLINKAKLAQFIPLTKEIITKNIIRTPFDISLLGMGLDGHFASLFPELLENISLFELKRSQKFLKLLLMEILFYQE